MTGYVMKTFTWICKACDVQFWYEASSILTTTGRRWMALFTPQSWLWEVIKGQAVADARMLYRYIHIHSYTLDQFTKTFFWNFQSIRADLCYILIYKQMLEKAFCSNIAPSLSSGNHLFYKAEYMGRSCPNQVWTITFDWSALATWNKHFQTAFW